MKRIILSIVIVALLVAGWWLVPKGKEDGYPPDWKPQDTIADYINWKAKRKVKAIVDPNLFYGPTTNTNPIPDTAYKEPRDVLVMEREDGSTFTVAFGKNEDYPDANVVFQPGTPQRVIDMTLAEMKKVTYIKASYISVVDSVSEAIIINNSTDTTFVETHVVSSPGIDSAQYGAEAQYLSIDDFSEEDRAISKALRGVMFPPGTPPDVVNRIVNEIRDKALRDLRAKKALDKEDML